MKWKNKGHEFDRFKEIFTWHKPIYIYGGGVFGEDLYKRISFVDCVEGFIDNNKSGQIGDKKVISAMEFLELDKKDCIVIIAASIKNTTLFKNQLLVNGYEEGKNLFLHTDWLNFYAPIYFMYAWNKLYLRIISFLCTTKCNLNCYGCLNFTSYNHDKKHYDLERLKKDADLLFNIVDYIDLFHISGGEPFSFPYLKDLLRYISQNYGHKIYNLATTTNGTIVPDDDLCKVMEDHNINLFLDDYRENVPRAKEKYTLVREKCDHYKINIIDNKVDSWINLLRGKNISEKHSDRDLEIKFSACNLIYKSLHNKKLYVCNYTDYAVEAGIVEENDNDFLSLVGFSDEKRMELLEFMMGYSDRGYSELCKKCNGFATINTGSYEVAKQQ